MIKTSNWKSAIIAYGVSLAALASAGIISQDDFDPNNANNTTASLTTGSRLEVQDANNGFVIDNGGDSPFTITNGTLTNSNVNGATANESGALQVVDIAPLIGVPVTDNAAPQAPAKAIEGDETEVTFTFDFDVEDNAELFFHAIGLTDGGATNTGTTDLNNFINNGDIQSQFDGFNGAGNGQGDFNDINFLDGTPTNGTANEALASFAGGTSGTFTQTIDITQFSDANGNALTEIADFDLIIFGFATNITGTVDNGITIDNFSFAAVHPIVVPEPKSILTITLLLGLALSQRKRRNSTVVAA